MRISERARAFLCAVLAASTLAGCARSAARPPSPTATPATSIPASSSGPAALQASQARHGTDPAEEITQSELSSIPDPVSQGESAGTAARAQGRQAGNLGPQGGSPGKAPQSAGSPSSGPREATLGDSRAAIEDSGPMQPGYIWRVQIFAAQDLSLADRKAKDAEEQLGVKSHIEFETPFYKVRLGDYASEGEAQSLREKAIQAGYAGAFRVRCDPDTTQYEN